MQEHPTPLVKGRNPKQKKRKTWTRGAKQGKSILNKFKG